MPKAKQLIALSVLCLMLVSLSTFAQPQISGPQSGTLGPGTYLVVGDIQIRSGETLTIMPGTELLHNGHWYWYIFGELTAVGTETDSISFIRQNPVPEHRWGGIRYQPGAPASTLSYCVIDNAEIPTGASSTYRGGGIHSNGVVLTVSHSRISNCDSYWGGGGMYIQDAAGVTIEECLIVDNLANLDNGGGILLNNCSGATITNCVIARNASTGT